MIHKTNLNSILVIWAFIRYNTRMHIPLGLFFCSILDNETANARIRMITTLNAFPFN
jgi:hypothetical protein